MAIDKIRRLVFNKVLARRVRRVVVYLTPLINPFTPVLLGLHFEGVIGTRSISSHLSSDDGSCAIVSGTPQKWFLTGRPDDHIISVGPTLIP